MKENRTKGRQGIQTGLVTRRQFNSFFILGGLAGLLRKKTLPVRQDKVALFWKKTDAS